MQDELAEVITDLRRHLAWQQADGVRTVLRDRTAVQAARSPEAPAAAASPAFEPISLSPAAPRPPSARAPPVGPPTSATARTPDVKAPLVAATGDRGSPKTLDEIRRELGDCRRCKLCSGRTQLVFGVGNPRAELVFVGEGPGAEEDAQGVPFVGKAGQLLTKMIEAMGFSRDDVYICNVVKCRPPNNRNPEPDEIEACEPFLRAQLQSIRPKAVVALGKFAAQTLLREATPISRLRGQWREYEGIPLMPTFHPAYLLRQPQDKKLAWSDLQQVMKLFGKEPNKPA